MRINSKTGILWILLVFGLWSQSSSQVEKLPKQEDFPSALKGQLPPGESPKISPALARLMIRDLIQKRALVAGTDKMVFGAYTLFEAQNVRVTHDALTFDYDIFKDKKRKTLHANFKWNGYLDYLLAYKDPWGLPYYIIFSFQKNYLGMAGGGYMECFHVFAWKDGRDAQAFCDAVNRLIAEFAGVKSPIEDLPSFAEKAKAWREHPEGRTKPPEDWNKFRILAEQAIKDKDFTGAIHNYDLALIAFPTWPEGWFNLAVLFESLGEYEGAANRMRHYLELLPDAPDAQAAKEKIIIWEDKAKK